MIHGNFIQIQFKYLPFSLIKIVKKKVQYLEVPLGIIVDFTTFQDSLKKYILARLQAYFNQDPRAVEFNN